MKIGITTGTSTSPAIYEVHLFAADASQAVTSGMTHVSFAVVELRAEPLPDGVNLQQTTISVTNGLLGIQNDESGTSVDAILSPGTLIVN